MDMVKDRWVTTGDHGIRIYFLDLLLFRAFRIILTMTLVSIMRVSPEVKHYSLFSWFLDLLLYNNKCTMHGGYHLL